MKAVLAVLFVVVALSTVCRGLEIGSWNIQILGDTKWAKLSVRDDIVATIQRANWDVFLVMEIRDADAPNVADELLAALQAQVDANYALILGPRLGDSTSTEQYAYYYRRNVLEALTSYTFDDVNNWFQRPPLVAHWRHSASGFTFTTIGCHVTPDSSTGNPKTVSELNHLVDVYDQSVGLLAEDGAFIMGDFNADCSYLSNTAEQNLRFSTDPRFYWLIPDGVDTTVASSVCTYDRIMATQKVYDRASAAGAYYFDAVLSLSPADAAAVSDHYPVETALSPPTADSTTTTAAVSTSSVRATTTTTTTSNQATTSRAASTTTTTLTTSKSASSTTTSSSGGNGGGCFAAASRVRVLADNGDVVVKQLRDVRVGDKVESVDADMQRVYSDVYAVLHQHDNNAVPALRIAVDRSSPITVTPHHLLLASRGLLAAAALKPGDWLYIVDAGATTTPRRVLAVDKLAAVVRAPLTLNDRIVVDGVAASVYSFSEPLYQPLTAPLKLAYRLAPSMLDAPSLRSVIDLFVTWSDSFETRHASFVSSI